MTMTKKPKPRIRGPKKWENGGSPWTFYTQAELLARVPDQDTFTTAELQAIFGDPPVHVTTIWRYTGNRANPRLVSFGSASGNSNVYRREDLIKFIEAKYGLTQKPKQQGSDVKKNRRAGSKPAKPSPKAKGKKAKTRRR